jgi:hypothetical protein
VTTEETTSTSPDAGPAETEAAAWLRRIAQAVSVGPGDALVIRVKGPMSNDQLDRYVADIAETVKSKQFDLQVLVVLADEIGVCRRATGQ